MALPSYGWAAPIQVLHGVFVDDVLVATYVFLMLVSGTLDSVFVDRRVRWFAGSVAILGALGLISTGVNAYRFFDVGQAVHLILFACLLLLASSWAARRGSTFVLRWFLTGLVCGGAINLFFSFARPKMLIGILPVLYMQNGAGGVLGLTVTLGAWLMFIKKSRADGAVAIATLLVGIPASAISYSKTSMSITAFGLVAWVCVFFHFSGNRLRLAGPLVVTLLLGGAAAYVGSESSPVTAAVVKIVAAKFTGLDLRSKYSVGARYMYFWGVLDIVSHHPVAGVSYGGFYDGITHAPSYQSGVANEEDPVQGALGESNPHNSFLYYTSANGIPGLILVVGLYLVFTWYLWLSLEREGWAGRIIWGCLALGYFIYANTLPTMYNTPILYAPAAVILARLARLGPKRHSPEQLPRDNTAVGLA